MSQPPEQQHWTHDEAVGRERLRVLDDYGVEQSDFAQSFLRQPITHRVRVHAVRSQLARFAIEHLDADDLAFGAYIEHSDEVSVLRPALLELRSGLHAPVATVVKIGMRVLMQTMGGGDIAELVQELRTKPSPELAELQSRIALAPPTYPGWSELSEEDIQRAFAGDPPAVSDRKELYGRIKAACSLAMDRELIDSLARQNPGFLDYLQCFPLARTMKRRVIAWLGPTNSGKTHRAVEALRAAPSGLYLGPLRLLALEQRDRLVDLGRPCSLITGEERDETSDTHSARTVEMADFNHRYHTCVLDEMQLAFDRDRGWAWIAAYCGVGAEQLIVTGPASTEPVIRRLAELCGDEVEVHLLDRQGALRFEGVLDWRHVPPRSAVIGFSRAMVLELKAMFEARGLSVAIIYGGLTPEVRRGEARRFREGEADIVCATDAIGMGLNLPLDRVIFYETDKFDGEVNRPLTRAEILQIGGRAGRGPGADGWVAALSSRDARRIQSAMSGPQGTPDQELLPAAPTGMHVRAIADHLGLERLQPILEFFRTRLTFPGGTFFPEVQEDVFAAAELVDLYAGNLPVEQKYSLACTPIDLEEHAFRNAFAEWLEALAAGYTAKFPRQLESADGLDGLEEMLQLTTIYRWLALKFPDTFTDLEKVEHLRRGAIEQTQAILRRNWSKHGLKRRECAHCGRAILPSSPHRTCRECHFEGYD